MADVINFTGITKHKIPPDKILEAAKDLKLDTIVLLGYNRDGDEYFCSSTPDGGEVIWLLQRSIFELMRMASGEDDE